MRLAARAWRSGLLPILGALALVGALGLLTIRPWQTDSERYGGITGAYYRCLVNRGAWFETPVLYVCFAELSW